jgi:hypothetical protein
MWMADHLKVRSEKKFAVAFLAYFGKEIPLTHHPEPVIVEDIGSYAPDFQTAWGDKDSLFYEVTEHEDTFGNSKKQRQFIVMTHYLGYYPKNGHLEIKGGALRHLDQTMRVLDLVYCNEIVVPKAQRLINELGRNDAFMAPALLRGFAKI